MFQFIRRSEELRKNEEETRKVTFRSISGDREAHFELLDLMNQNFDLKRSPRFQIIWKKKS